MEASQAVLLASVMRQPPVGGGGALWCENVSITSVWASFVLPWAVASKVATIPCAALTRLRFRGRIFGVHCQRICSTFGRVCLSAGASCRDCSRGFGTRLLGDVLAGAYQCSASACAMAFIAHRLDLIGGLRLLSCCMVLLFRHTQEIAEPGESLSMDICCGLPANGGSPQMPHAVYIFPRTSVGRWLTVVWMQVW